MKNQERRKQEGRKHMSQKLLTISIAAYNAEKTLCRTLDSLILPTEWMNFLDVIVVNDGSTDATREIAQDYAKKYPNVVRVLNKDNGGHGSTFNASSKIAKGKYFRLLDADDWFATEHLTDYLDYLKDTDADCVLTPYKRINERDSSEERIDHFARMKQVVMDVDKIDGPKRGVAMHEFCVRTDLIQPEGFHACEKCYYVDNEFVLQGMLKCRTITCWLGVIYCYLVGQDEQSCSLEGKKRHYKDLVRTAEHAFSYCEPLTLNKWQAQSLLRISHEAYNVFFEIGDTDDYKKELIQWDKRIKERYPCIYRLTMSDWKIKMMRITGFAFFKAYGAVKQKRKTHT